VDLIYVDADPPIARRFEGLHLIGTFELVGPDQGRFEPFWRLAARGREILTVRRPDAPAGMFTTLPILLSDELVKEFLTYVGEQLAARGTPSAKELTTSQLVIRAASVQVVPSAEDEVRSLLKQNGLEPDCTSASDATFCLRLPERNNFQAALKEQKKLESGGAFFSVLLVMLIGIGTAGLEVQLVVARWREFGILQAVGFSAAQILLYFAIRLYALLAAAIVVGAVVALPFAPTVSTFAFAAAIALAAVSAATLPVLFWPLAQAPAQLLRVSA
jgi:hypothetical protein